jgi:hypothetical protein
MESLYTGAPNPSERAWNKNANKGSGKSKSEALKVAKSKGHKHGEREARAKKLGYYPNGHKNFGDVYEA